MFRTPTSTPRRARLRLAGLAAIACLAAAGAAARDVSVTARAVVRSRPEPLAPVLAIVQPTGIVTLQETTPGWLRVATRDGQVGYVAGGLSGQSLVPDERAAMPGRDVPRTLRVALDTELRASPAAGSAVTASLPAGVQVTVASRMGDWVQVEAGEAAGWLDLLASPVDTAPGREPGESVAQAAAPRAPRREAAMTQPPGDDDAAARRAELRAEREEREAAERAEREQRAAAQRAAREAEARPEAEPAPPASGATPDDGAARRAQLRAEREAREAAERAEREQRAAAQRAAREAEARPQAEPAPPSSGATPDDAAARRAQLRAEREAREAAERTEREAREAAEKAEREQRAATQRASREAEARPAAEPAPPAAGATPDDAAARRAQLRAEREAREAAERGEREAREAAERAEREAREAAARAERVRPEAPTAPQPPQEDPTRAAREQADAAQKAQREEAARLRAEEEAQRKAQADAQRAARDAERQAREAERAAQAERERLEKERIAQAQREAEERERTRVPPPPVDIPAAVPVAIDPKAPNERKRDPQTNPLVRQGMPPAGPAPQSVTASAARPAPEGFRPFDTDAQVERSVASLHEDRARALELSTGEAAPERAPSSYVGEDARTVPTTVVSQIVARVNDEIVTNTEFERRLQEMLDEGRRTGRGALAPGEEREVRRRLLIMMIEQMLLVDEAKALGVPFDRVYDNAKQRFMKQAGITDDLELVQLLDATGRTWDEFRRELLRGSVPALVLKNQVYGTITVPEADVEAHYRLHQEDWSEEPCVRLREIVLQPDPKERSRDFNARLEGMLTALEAGADFCDIARRYSKAASKDDCGLLPQCFTRGQLDEKVALVAFRMKPGDVEPITTEWGYHVVRLEELKPRHMRALPEVRDQIVDKLRAERANDQMRRYVDRLRESAKIELAPGYRELVEGNATARGGGP